MKIQNLRVSPSHSVTSSSGIYDELVYSKENGNVVGIWSNLFKNVVCLTAVEDIIDVEISDDKLIILKKIDLQGIFLNNNRIYLSEIDKVISFAALYNEHLMQCLQESSEDAHIKIRQRQQFITVDDLKLVFIRNINSGNKISISLINGETRSCYVTDFNPHAETVILSCELNNENPEEICIKDIGEIEFEFHYDYKGFSSKTFRINPDVCLLLQNTGEKMTVSSSRRR